MRFYPSPNFYWYRGNDLLNRSSRRYYTNLTSLPEDMYHSRLTIFDISGDDYGEYTCKAENNIGDHKTIIKLQPKSASEAPTDLKIFATGTNSLEVSWEEGFDGGMDDTKFIVVSENAAGSHQEYDCQSENPCLVTNLHAQTDYSIKIRAYNIKGESDYSASVVAATGLDAASIPLPGHIFFERISQALRFTVDSTPLQLQAEVKKISEGDTEWKVIPGSAKLAGVEFKEIFLDEKFPEQVKMRLCTTTGGKKNLCGPFVDAEIGEFRRNESLLLSKISFYL